ncbi:Cyclin-D1-binding protein 1, partial [Kappamyces sp. JEL0680]
QTIEATLQLIERDTAKNNQLFKETATLDVVPFQNLAKLISHQATAWTLTAGHGSGQDDVAKELDKCVSLLGLEMLRVTPHVGSLLHTKVTKLAVELLFAIQYLVQGKDAEDCKTRTGQVWECCDNLAAIPTTQAELVIGLLNSVVGMLNDASDEAKQLLSGVGFDGEQLELSADETDFISHCVNLIKTSLLCVKKAQATLKRLVAGNADGLFLVAESDTLLKTADQCSAKADDLVCAMDIPLDFEDTFLHSSAQELAALCKSLTAFVERHSAGDQKWLELCASQLEKLSLGIAKPSVEE